MFEWTQLTLFLYIVMRMSGFVLFNPLFGRKEISAIFRTGLILVLSVAVNSFTTQRVETPTNLVVFILRLLLELALGYLLGLIVAFFFSIPALAGEVIDTQMGMTMAKTYDAGSQASMSVSSTLLNILMVLLFFAANGHYTLLRILLTSGDIVPYGEVMLTSSIASAVAELFIESVLLSVKLCLPVLAAELMGQVGMGILMKAIPQINVFAINIELKVLVGLVMMFFLISPFSTFLLDAEKMMLGELQTILTMVS